MQSGMLTMNLTFLVAVAGLWLNTLGQTDIAMYNIVKHEIVTVQIWLDSVLC